MVSSKIISKFIDCNQNKKFENMLLFNFKNIILIIFLNIHSIIEL